MQSQNIQNPGTIINETPASEATLSKPEVKTMPDSSEQKTPSLKNNFATFTVVFGVLSIVVSILSPCGMLFGMMGTIFGFKAKRISENNSSVTIGIILNIIGLILSLVFAILYAIVLSTPELLN